MKSTTHHSFLDRRALVVAGMSVLLGAATAGAQTNTGTPGTTRGSAAHQTESTRGTYSSDSTPSASSSTDSTKSGTSTTGQTDVNAGYGASSTTGTTTSGTTGGATTMTGRDSSSGKLGWMERRWVNKVADSGMTEVALAQLAAEKSTNPEVKSFAQKLIQDHTMVNEELKSLAGAKNVKLDDEDLGSDRAHKRLSKKSGVEFDQEFVEHMVDMHEADVKLFEKASADAKDSALKSFAAKHVDHLRQHLQQAQSLRSSIVPTGRMERTDNSRANNDATSTSTDTNAPAPSTGTTGSAGSTSSDTPRRNPNP